MNVNAVFSFILEIAIRCFSVSRQCVVLLRKPDVEVLRPFVCYTFTWTISILFLCR